MKIDRAIFHPDYKREPFWWEAARPGTQYSVDLPAATDVLIVGSGYAGLSAALELAREGRTATVVDAMAFGEGASTRNGGCVSAGINIGKGLSGGPGQQALSQQQTVADLISESLAAFEFVQTLIDREGIDCHYEQRGRFVGAFSEAHYPGLFQKAESLNRQLGLDASVISRDEQRSEIGSDFYHGGIVINRAGKLHPSLFHKGLLEACNGAGVTLCAHTKVEAITGAASNFTIKINRGSCRAEHVIIATNG